MTEEATPLAVPTFVRERRKLKKLTQAELAHNAGLSTAAIHNLEAGKNGFTDKSLAAIARVLECSPVELLTDPKADGSPAVGEAAVKVLLRRIAGLPEDAINPAWKMISGLLEDAGQSQSDSLRGRSESANRPREEQPSQSRFQRSSS
ncbi:helix-turn-helix domain-containing protein [Mesorhizobium sp. BH1-1-5]|uniref:helix-turn-helix domain-containing protein n=1 Tax=Mesorhizobium sp. BH1-1-5 TaxID=2876661 RepID=UPI001CCD9CA4|nr:helix-turn-helix domain-containing protein [Mesorhizobium sp. BH1-1-5]MBZ9985701.1 helix-turn-helix domain-containing protein [Mesorhizobium sp. BH1-1-5]